MRLLHQVASMHHVSEYDAKCITIQYNLGRLYEQRGEVLLPKPKYSHRRKVYPCFLKTTTLCACHAPCWCLEQVEKAIQKYKAILAHHPSYPGCFLRLASCAEAAGEEEEATGWAQKELHLHPKRPEAFCALGNMCLGMDDLKHADQNYKLCDSIPPSFLLCE